MKHTHARPAMAVTALALAAGLVLAGCGSDGQDAASSPAPSADGTTTDPPGGASATAGDYELTGFWVKESSLDLSAGFGTITNNGDSDDALIGAAAAQVPTVELHQTVDNVMQQTDSFSIPAGQSLVLSPGGHHLMLVGLAEPLTVGGEIEITLQFASGSTASITAPIKPFSGDDGHDDGDDGHDDSDDGHDDSDDGHDDSR